MTTTYTIPTGTDLHVRNFDGSTTRWVEHTTRKAIEVTVSATANPCHLHGLTYASYALAGKVWMVAAPIELTSEDRAARLDHLRSMSSVRGPMLLDVRAELAHLRQQGEYAEVIPHPALLEEEDEGVDPRELYDVAPAWLDARGEPMAFVRSESTPGDVYLLSFDAQGRATTCSCKGHKFHGRCKHAARVRACGAWWAAAETMLDAGLSVQEIKVWWAAERRHHDTVSAASAGFALVAAEMLAASGSEVAL